MKKHDAEISVGQKCKYLSATFLKLFDSYAEEHFKDPDTKKEYWEIICFLCNHAEADFLELTLPLVQGYFTSIQPSVSLGTRKHRMRVYTAVARYADENALLYNVGCSLSSVFQLVALEDLEMEYTSEDYPPLEDIDRLLSYFKGIGDLVMFISICLALFCSQTPSMLIKLKKEMFIQDLAGNYGIRIQISNLNYRFIKIPEELAQLIIQYTQSRSDDSPYLLLNAYSQPLGTHTLYQRLREACKECGISQITIRKLNILGTTLMIKGGAPLDKVAEHINVKNKYWFFRYNRVVKELEKSAVDYIHFKLIY